jgi:mono/diheme cytochrome c family protein
MKRILPISLLILLLAACSGSPAASPLPTPTLIPTYQYVSPTPLPPRATLVATLTPEVDAAAAAIEAGRGRFEALGCGGCHGANAEGGEGPALAGLTMSEEDFVTVLRSGGSLGSQHQFASNRLSGRGATNIYVYLQSLSS